MTVKIFDRIKERVQNGAGIGQLTLLGAPTGFKTFSSRLNDGDSTYYCIEGPGGSFEIGIGTFNTPNVLLRTTVLRSSNSDNAISIGSGQYFIFISYIADKSVYKDILNRIVVGSAGIVFSDNSVQTTAPRWGSIGGTLSNQTDLVSALFSKVNKTTTILTGVGLSGGGNLSSDITVSLSNTSVIPGDYTFANITVDAQGRITNASSGPSCLPLTGGSLSGALTLFGAPTLTLHAATKGYVDSAVNSVDLSSRVPNSRTISINGTSQDLSIDRAWTVGDVRMDGSYSNPAWLTSLAFGKLTGLPTTLSGYGIADAVPYTGASQAVNLGAQNLSAGAITASGSLIVNGSATTAATAIFRTVALQIANTTEWQNNAGAVGARITATQRFSHCAPALAQAEQFGDMSSVASHSSAFGFAATTQQFGAAFGQSAYAGQFCTALGRVAGTSGTSGGIPSTHAFSRCITIADGTDFYAPTASNQFMVAGEYTEAFFGKGVTSSSPSNIRFQTTSGSGTNIAGADFIIAGGRGTGTGVGGTIRFQTAPAGTTGSSLNTLVDRLTIDSTGLITANGSRITTNGIIQAGNVNGARLVAQGGLELGISETILWSGTVSAAGGKDTGIRRNAAGVVEINNGTAGTSGTLAVNDIRMLSGNNVTMSVGAAGSTSALLLNQNGFNYIRLMPGTGIQVANFGVYAFASSGFNPTGLDTDTALARRSAGAVEVNNGVAGTLRDFFARNITASGTIRIGTPATVTGSNGPLSMATDGAGTGFSVVQNAANYVRFVSGGVVHGFISESPTLGLSLQHNSHSVIVGQGSTLLLATGVAQTGLTASTESTDVNFNLARTVQFSGGNITTQRAVRVQAPTYSFTTPSTITTASTLSISGAPVAGTNATITNSFALNVESGRSRFGDMVSVTNGVFTCAVSPTVMWLGDSGGVGYGGWSTAGLSIGRGLPLSFGSGNINVFSGGVGDVFLFPDAADTLAMRRGFNAQTFRVYNTWTSATNFETLQIQNVAGAGTRIGYAIGSAGGTGGANRRLDFGRWNAANTWTSLLTWDANDFAVFSTNVMINDTSGFSAFRHASSSWGSLGDGSGFAIASNGYQAGPSESAFTTRTGSPLNPSRTASIFSAVHTTSTSTSYWDFRVAAPASLTTTSVARIGFDGSFNTTGPLSWTPRQSSLDPTTTDIPNGRRVSWYNSTTGEFRDWVNINGVLFKSAPYTT